MREATHARMCAELRAQLQAEPASKIAPPAEHGAAGDAISGQGAAAGTSEAGAAPRVTPKVAPHEVSEGWG